MLSARPSSRAHEQPSNDDEMTYDEAAYARRDHCARGGIRKRVAGAQKYPTRAITVIIPFAGGSASDVVSRIMFDKMSKNMGQPIIIENRPGAGGNSGTSKARRRRRTAIPWSAAAPVRSRPTSRSTKSSATTRRRTWR